MEGKLDGEILKLVMEITFVVRLITTAETNQTGGELYGVGLTGYKGNRRTVRCLRTAHH